MRGVLLVIVLLSVLAFACGGGGDGLSLEEYVDQVQVSLRDTDQRAGDISGPLNVIGGDEPLDQQIEAARTYLSDLVPIADEFVTTLEAMDAPAEAGAVHAALIAAWEDLRDRGQQTLGALEDAQSEAELQGEFGLFLQDASAGVFAACDQLQVIAYDANLRADFDCET